MLTCYTNGHAHEYHEFCICQLVNLAIDHCRIVRCRLAGIYTRSVISAVRVIVFYSTELSSTASKPSVQSTEERSTPQPGAPASGDFFHFSGILCIIMLSRCTRGNAILCRIGYNYISVLVDLLTSVVDLLHQLRCASLNRDLLTPRRRCK